MVKFTSIILVLTYLVAIARPFMPFIEYQIHMDYYANVLCKNKSEPVPLCNGQCVLTERLKEATTESTPGQPTKPSQVASEDFITANLPPEASLNMYSEGFSPLGSRIDLYRYNDKTPPTPPPQFQFTASS